MPRKLNNVIRGNPTASGENNSPRKLKNVTVDSSRVYGLEKSTKDSFDKLQEYQKRLRNNEYISADEISAYRKARTNYADSYTRLNGIAKATGGTIDADYEKQQKDWLAWLDSSLDEADRIFSQYDSAEDYTYATDYSGLKTYGAISKKIKELEGMLTRPRYARSQSRDEKIALGALDNELAKKGVAPPVSSEYTDEEIKSRIKWLENYAFSNRDIMKSMTEDELDSARGIISYIRDGKDTNYFGLYNNSVDDADNRYAKYRQDRMIGVDTNPNPVLYYDDNNLPVYLDERIGQLRANEDVDALLEDAEIANKSAPYRANERVAALLGDKEYTVADSPYLDYYETGTGSPDDQDPAETGDRVFSQEEKNKMLAGISNDESSNSDMAAWGWSYENPFTEPPNGDFLFKTPLGDGTKPLQESYEHELEMREQVESLGYDWDAVRYYLKYLRSKSEHNDAMEGWKSFADDYPVLATVGNILGSPFKLIDLFGNLSYSAYGIANPYDDTFVNASGAITGRIAENVEDSLGGGWVGKGASIAYSGITSAASSAVTGLASTAIFGPVAGPNIAMVLLGSQAAADKFNQTLMNGGSYSEAFTTSLIAGIAEAGFERIGLDNLFKTGKNLDVSSVANLIKSALKQTGKQGLVEALEETGTNIVNELADQIVNGDSSQYERTVERLMLSGMSEGEARKKAEKQYWESLISDALGGFFGGLASGGGANIVGGIANYGDARFNGQSVKTVGVSVKTNPALLDDILNVAEAIKGDADVTNALKSVKHRNSDYNVGSLMLAVDNALIKEFGAVETVDQLDTVKNKYGDNNYVAEVYASEYERLTGHEYTAPEVQQNLAYTTDIPVNESAQKSAKIPSVPASDSIVRSKDGVGYRAVTTNGKDTVVYGVDPETGNFTTSEGVIPSDQITFSDRATKAVFDNARNYSDTVADLYIGAYDPGAVTVVEYDQAFGRFYKAGNVLNVQSFEDAWNNYSVYGIFDKATAEIIYKAGQNEARIVNRVQSEFRKGKSRVYVDVDRKSLTSRQKVSIEAMEAIAKATGIRFYTFASYVKDGKRYYKNSKGVEKPAPNGYYDPKDSSIHIDLNAGNSGEGTMLFTVSHELVHYIKQWSPKKFKILADFLLEQYGKKGVSVETLVQAQIEKAKTARNEDIDEDTAFEEVVADSMESMLTDGKVAEKLTVLAEKDMSLVKKIKSYLKQLFDKIRQAYAGLNPNSREGRFVAEMGDAVEKLQNLFAEAIADASENRANMANGEATRSQANGNRTIKYSLSIERSGKIIRKSYTQQELESNAVFVTNMASVYDVPASKLERSGKDTKEMFSDYFKSIGNEIVTEEFGHIAAGNSSVRSEVRHGITAEKIASMEAIPDVVNKGKVIWIETKNNTDVERIIVCAPITIGSEPYYMGVMLQRDSRYQRLYLHDVIIEKETTFSSQADLITTGALEEKDSFFTTTILQKVLSVKYGDKKISDQAYSSAVENGDMETAQQMVDEAARQAGYTIRAYHGTLSDDFTVFDKSYIGSRFSFDDIGFFFTNRKSIAEDYASSEFDSSKKGKVFDTFLKVKNPLNVDKQFCLSNGLGNVFRDNDAIGTWDNYSDYLKEEAENIRADGIIIDDGISKMIVVFNPEQIKSADPVTYDDNGDVIPLSKRFDDSKSDIRYSDRGFHKTAALEEFGTTRDFAQTGFVTDDGRMLNLSRYGQRGVQHKQIETVFNDAKGDEAVNRFIQEGNVRIKATAPGIEIGTENAVTTRQLNAVSRFISESLRSRGMFYLDITDPSGNEVASVEYDDSMSTSDVIYDIKDYYERGRVPKAVSYSERDPDAVSTRSILADALGSAAQTEAEKTRLAEYKEKADTLDQKQAELAEIRAQIKELAFAKGKKDTAKLAELRKKAAKLASSIDYYDKQLLGLEATKDLKAVLQREKAKAAKRQKAKDAVMLERYKEGRKKTELRTKIKKFKAKLESAMLNPTDNTYVPAGLISAMVDVCELIDTDTDLYKKDGSLNKAQEARNLTRDRLLALEDEYSKLAENEEYVIGGEFDESVQAYLKDLRTNYSGKKLSEMSLEELSVLYDVLNSVNDVLQDAKSLIGFSDAVGVYEAADSIVGEQSSIAEKHRKGGKRSLGQKGVDLVVHKSLSPVRAAERMSGYNRNSFLVRLFNNFEKGVRKKNMFKMQAYKVFEELVTGKNAADYESAMYDTYGHDYTDERGRTFHVSKMQAMQALLSYEREQANKKTLHIENGGLNFADIDILSKGKLGDAIDDENIHRVKGEAAVAMVEEFRELLKDDAWAQKYMEAARTFFNSMAKDAINSTMLAVKHRIVAKDNFYIPYEVDKSFVVMEITGGYDMQQTINSYGMLQQMKDGAAQPLIVTGLNNIIDRHIEQVGTVYGLAVPVRDFNKVWNTRSGSKPVNVAIGENWGKEAKDLITQAVADIQSPRVAKDDPFLRKVKSNYISATFFANFSVITKQIGSMYSARSMIRHRSAPQMLANLAYTMFNYKKISAEVDKYTASVWMRRQGVSDAEVYDLLTEGKKHGIGKLASKIPVVKHLPNLIAAMDSAVALSLWKYCKQDVAKATGKTGEELLEATAEYFDEVVENTQSMADVLHRPEIQKQGGIIGESFGMFKTDLYQMAGQLQTALGRHKAEGTKETKRALAKAAYGCLSSAIWASLMTTLFALGRYKVDPYRDDEDELTAESWLKYQSLGLVGDLAGYVFPLAGGEMVGVAKRFITGESDELVDSLALTAIQDGIDTVFTIADSLKEGEMPSLSEIDKFLGKSLQMFSVPYNNVSRSVKAIKYHIQDIANGEFLSFNEGSRGGASNAAKVDRYSGYIDNNDKPVAKDYITGWVDARVLELIENDELEKANVDKDEYLKAYYTNEAKKDVRGYFNSKYKKEYLSAVDKGDWKVTKRIKSILASTGLYENVDDTFISWRRSAVADKYELNYKRAYKTNDTKAMEKIKNAIVATDLWIVADVNKKLKSWRKSADELTEEAEG